MSKVQIETFLEDNLDVEIEVMDVYSLGEGNNIAVNMATEQQKLEMLKNKSKLKDIVNNEGKGYYINEFLTPEENEKRTHERQIFQKNRRSTANKVEMSFFKGGLKIQNEKFKKKVTTPEPVNFLTLTEEELDQIMKIKTPQGQRVVADGNAMIGFSCPVSTHAEINQAHTKVKLKYPQAKHIVCTYQIPGTEPYYNANYCDDGDIGIGRRILDLMDRNKITSRVNFVARYSDGTKLGGKRFQMYLDAAKNAIEALPYNWLTQTNQQVNRANTTWKPTQPKYNKVVRGGYQNPREGRTCTRRQYILPSEQHP